MFDCIHKGKGSKAKPFVSSLLVFDAGPSLIVVPIKHDIATILAMKANPYGFRVEAVTYSMISATDYTHTYIYENQILPFKKKSLVICLFFCSAASCTLWGEKAQFTVLQSYVLKCFHAAGFRQRLTLQVIHPSQFSPLQKSGPVSLELDLPVV